MAWSRLTCSDFHVERDERDSDNTRANSLAGRAILIPGTCPKTASDHRGHEQSALSRYKLLQSRNITADLFLP